ncbi:MAG: chitobiase/beta-hexosaminidase C-terminal domain-containing protein [Prevotella sp.]|nr:chitobiase/beta-hexosaminidase C-terminal domain-containing protein [Prevotella sp.]
MVDIKVGDGNQICVLITLTGTAPVATQVATPTFSPEESEFSTDKLDVTISCVTSESTILYSTNGVDYTTYSEPISISATTTIYAKATKTGLADSEVTSKTYTKVESIDVFDATGENTTFVLTKANITAAKNAFVNVTTENWNTGKTYGDYSGDFYNMSSEDRQLSIKVTGAKSFEVFVQNTNSGRSYDVTVGSATTNVPHPATGIASSGVFAIADPSAETTITLGGTGSSVYPVYIVFNPAVDAEITSAGYATFSSDKAVDFSGASGVTVYAAKVNDTKTAVDLIEVKSKQVPANTAVVLKGAAGTYSASAIASAATISGNQLQIAAATMDGSAGNIFVLNEVGGVVGFYKLSASGSLLAGKGYLEVDGVGEGRSMFEIDIDGISTGISKMEDVRSKKDDVYYDLQGRRVLNPTKGLYIVNGKKVIVK